MGDLYSAHLACPWSGLRNAMQCSACGADSPPANRFCGSCGSQLAAICAACGAQNPSDHRFCGQCGAPIDAGAAGPPRASNPAPAPVAPILADPTPDTLSPRPLRLAGDEER